MQQKSGNDSLTKNSWKRAIGLRRKRSRRTFREKDSARTSANKISTNLALGRHLAKQGDVPTKSAPFPTKNRFKKAASL